MSLSLSLFRQFLGQPDKFSLSSGSNPDRRIDLQHLVLQFFGSRRSSTLPHYLFISLAPLFPDSSHHMLIWLYDHFLCWLDGLLFVILLRLPSPQLLIKGFDLEASIAVSLGICMFKVYNQKDALWYENWIMHPFQSSSE